MNHVLSQGSRSVSGVGTGQSTGALGNLDPRVRIIATILFGICVVSLATSQALLVALATSISLLLMSNLPIKQTLKRMAIMDGFIFFTLAMLPFTVPGDAMFTLWGFPASWQGVQRAIEIALTANAVILAVLTLVGTMEPVTFGHALHKLRCPETLVHLMMFTIRYIDVLREEYLRLRSAMKVRGFRPRSNWHTYRSIGYLVGMMLVRSIERSERILEAMKCRGFNGRILLLQDFRLTRTDALFAIGFLVVITALIALDVSWR